MQVTSVPAANCNPLRESRPGIVLLSYNASPGLLLVHPAVASFAQACAKNYNLALNVKECIIISNGRVAALTLNQNWRKSMEGLEGADARKQQVIANESF